MRVAGVLGLVVLLCLGGCGEGPTESSNGLNLVARPALTDTVRAAPVQAIVVLVRTPSGALSVGTTVQFRGLLNQGIATMQVRNVTGVQFVTSVSAVTDARGQALAQVLFGPLAGPAAVEVAVPEFGLADTIPFTVLPGALARIIATPQDTAIHPGATIQFQSGTKDQFGNLVTAPITWQVVTTPAGVATISTGGLLTGSAPARAMVVAQSGVVADTVFVSLVPPGSYVAVHFPEGLVLSDLDGSSRRILLGSPPVFSDMEPAWSPDGAEVAVTPSLVPSSIQLVRVAGGTTTITWPVAVTGDAYWPAFSRDGQFLYFTEVRNSGGIHRIRVDGSGLENVVADCICYRPSVSPDGRFVTFHTIGTVAEIVIRVFDQQTKSFLGGEVPGRFPEWSPVGSSIAYIEAGRLRLMNSDGTGIRYITAPGHSYFEQQLSWSPDGVWLLAASVDSRLEVIDVATGLILPLPGLPFLSQPAWRP